MNKLTLAALRKIEPKKGMATRSIPDGTVGGLSVRFGARGHASFDLVYRWGREPAQIRKQLGFFWDPDRGPAPSARFITLEQARIMALQIKEAAFTMAPDLLPWVAGSPVAEKPKITDAVSTILDRYAREHLSTLKTGNAFGKLLTQSLPLDRSITTITRADIRAVLDGHMSRGHGFLANRVHATLLTFFAWCADHELVPVSPMAGMKRPMKNEDSRDRVLSDAELAAVWRAAEGSLSPARRDCLRVLMLTGARLSEIAGARWSELDGDILTVPKERGKAGSHLIILSPQALEIIHAQPCYTTSRTASQSVTSHAQTTPNSQVNTDNVDIHPHSAVDTIFDFGGKRADLSTLINTKVKPLVLDVQDWRIHDLRRTMASGMQDLGVRPEIIDKILHDVGSRIKGTAAVYMRSAYLPERRDAMTRWGQHVASLLA